MDVQTSKTGHKTKVVYSAIGSLTAGILFSLYMFNVYRKEIEAFRTVPMVGSHHPLILVVATALYLLAIYWFIPNYMKNREPAKMTWLKTAHNYFLVVFSFIIVYEAVPAVSLLDFIIFIFFILSLGMPKCKMICKHSSRKHGATEAV